MPGLHVGTILFDARGYPLNPRGRTGMRERGLLGKWGPNHAADPIVTRWQPGSEDVPLSERKLQVKLQEQRKM